MACGSSSALGRSPDSRTACVEAQNTNRSPRSSTKSRGFIKHPLRGHQYSRRKKAGVWAPLPTRGTTGTTGTTTNISSTAQLGPRSKRAPSRIRDAHTIQFARTSLPKSVRPSVRSPCHCCQSLDLQRYRSGITYAVLAFPLATAHMHEAGAIHGGPRPHFLVRHSPSPAMCLLPNLSCHF